MKIMISGSNFLQYSYAIEKDGDNKNNDDEDEMKKIILLISTRKINQFLI